MEHFQKRIKRLQQALKKQAVDAMIIDDLTNILYLTGLDLSLGRIIVTQRAARLIVDSRYIEKTQKLSPIAVMLRSEDTLKRLFNEKPFQKVETVAFDRETTTVDAYRQLQHAFRQLRKHYSNRNFQLKALPNLVRQLRSIKDSEEIKALKEAANLGSEGFDYVLTLLKKGVTEQEIAIELEIFWKRKGSKALAFDSIIAFGPHTSMPHYQPGAYSLKKGQAVLIDIGVNYRHYNSDMTRVVFLGKPPKKILEIYDIVLEAQEAALALCRPGTAIADLDIVAREFIDSKGYGEQFSHNLGHGVGLDVHELPNIRRSEKKVLEAGMVLTIEPGIYLADIGGVRLEDTVLITEKGHENLTKRPKEPLVL